MLDWASVRSFDGHSGSKVAIARVREEEASDGAQIIDLIQLPSGARPMPRAALDYEEVSDARALDCGAYAECLNFAARVHWIGFHCRRCPKFMGEHQDEALNSFKPAAVIRLR